MTKKKAETKLKPSEKKQIDVPISPGLIPDHGLITAEELGRRLDLQHIPYLKTEMENLGIPFVAINGKRLYRCSDIAGLIPQGKK